MYVADEAAIREQRLKVVFLDSHGQCVWWLISRPDLFLEYTGFASRGYSLVELHGVCGAARRARVRIGEAAKLIIVQ